MFARWPRLGWLPIVVLTSVAFGFLFATQLRAQIIPASDRVSRNQALVATVRRLESDNVADRARIEQLRADIRRLETEAAQRSDSDRRLAEEVNDLRAHAGLTRLRGPGVTVTLGDGRPSGGGAPLTTYLVNAQDVQDVLNLLFEGGAEGVVVNGRRISPITRVSGSGTAVVIDQGPPLAAPFRIAAVGNRDQMSSLLDRPSSLGDLKLRQRNFQLHLSWEGAPDLTLPPYDSSLVIQYARGG